MTGAQSSDSDTCAWIFDVQDRSTLELPQAWSAPLAVSADRSVVALTGPAQREVSFLRATDLSGAARAAECHAHRALDP